MVETKQICFYCVYLDPLSVSTMTLSGYCTKHRLRDKIYDIENTTCKHFKAIKGEKE